MHDKKLVFLVRLPKIIGEMACKICFETCENFHVCPGCAGITCASCFETFIKTTSDLKCHECSMGVSLITTFQILGKSKTNKFLSVYFLEKIWQDEQILIQEAIKKYEKILENLELIENCLEPFFFTFRTLG